MPSQRQAADDGHAAMADRRVALAAEQPGYLGMETAREGSGFGITASHGRSLEDIAAWRRHAGHRVAQQTGRTHGYGRFELRVAQVLRAHAEGTDLG